MAAKDCLTAVFGLSANLCFVAIVLTNLELCWVHAWQITIASTMIGLVEVNGTLPSSPKSVWKPWTFQWHIALIQTCRASYDTLLLNNLVCVCVCYCSYSCLFPCPTFSFNSAKTHIGSIPTPVFHNIRTCIILIFCCQYRGGKYKWGSLTSWIPDSK